MAGHHLLQRTTEFAVLPGLWVTMRPAENKKARLITGLIVLDSGGEEGIRTLVPDFSDHPISSRRRYVHFGTSPQERNNSISDP